MNPNLRVGFPLRCFQKLSYPNIATQHAVGTTADTPEVSPLRSSRTRSRSLQDSMPAVDNNQPVSRRSEPSSRTLLIGEQPNPWDLLQPQDRMSRHRCLS